MSTAQPNNTNIAHRKTYLVLSGIWLGLNALLHLLLFPFLLYTGLCTLLMPVSLWILSSLTTNPRIYALLNIPLGLYTLAWWFATPLSGVWFTLLWLPFALMGCMLRSKPLPDNSLLLRGILYIVALLPFIAMLPILIFTLRDLNS